MAHLFFATTCAAATDAFSRRQVRAPDTNARYGHPGLLMVLLTLAATGLAACVGSSARHVASLNNSGATSGRSAITSTTVGSVNPTDLLDEWATCMRSHGDPGQVDPTVTARGVIDVTYPLGYNPKREGESSSTSACTAYLTSASAALAGGPPVHDRSKMLLFSECMRANGIPDFPDPSDTGGTYHFPIGIHVNNSGISVTAPGTPGDLDPTNPKFQSAAKRCARKVSVPRWGYAPGSSPGSVVVTVDG